MGRLAYDTSIGTSWSGKNAVFNECRAGRLGTCGVPLPSGVYGNFS